MADIKWSAFPSIGNLATGDVLVGLRAGANVRFSALTIPWTVPNGGTGLTTATAYALLAGGTTATGAFQSLGTGTAGQLLQSGGSGALPSWTTSTFPSGSGTLNHMLRSDGTNWVETTATTLTSADVLSGLTQLNVDNLRLDGNTISSTDADGFVNVIPNGNGQLHFGSTSSVTGIGAGFFDVTIAKNSSRTFLNIAKNSSSASSGSLAFYTSRNTTVGSFTTLNNGDEIGNIQFNGDDGTSYVTSGVIATVVASAPSTGVIPTNMYFYTSNSAGVQSLALNLSTDQSASFIKNVLAPLGVVTSGSAAGGISGQFQAFATGAALGSTSLTAANNAGNFANVLTNASTAAARTWTLPDASGTIALTGSSVASITGTANQVLANATSGVAQTGAVTLTLPQSIATTSSPTFLAANLGNVGISGNTITTLDSNGNLYINPNGSGRIILDTATEYAPSVNVQVASVSSNCDVVTGTFSATPSNASIYYMYKSASTTVGVFSAVADGDLIGYNIARADDGTSFVNAAYILYSVDGAVSTGIVPGMMRFYTSNTAGAATEALQIDSSQIVTLANALPVGSGGLGTSTVPTAGQVPVGNGSGIYVPTTMGAGLPWSTIAGTTQAAAVNNGYVIGDAAQTTVTLPATAAVGSVVAVAGQGAGGFILAANTGQTIKFATSTTTSGGSLTSAEQYDYIQVVCIVADTTWLVQSAISTGFTPA